jgi:hypothetical protein
MLRSDSRPPQNAALVSFKITRHLRENNPLNSSTLPFSIDFCESAAFIAGEWWNAMNVFFVALSTIYGPISLVFQIWIALSAIK